MTINDLIATSSVNAFNSGLESGKALEQERIIKDFQAACRCEGNQTEGNFCQADWAIKIVNEYWKPAKK